jgi:tetratricopeptide (TPR) repeat protein
MKFEARLVSTAATIESARRPLGQTLRRIGDFLGCTAPTVHAYLRGERPVSFRDVLDLGVERLGLTEEEITAPFAEDVLRGEFPEEVGRPIEPDESEQIRKLLRADGHAALRRIARLVCSPTASAKLKATGLGMYGLWFSLRSERNKAISLFKAALAIADLDPLWATNFNASIGGDLISLGKFCEGTGYLQAVLDGDPQPHQRAYSIAYINHGVILDADQLESLRPESVEACRKNAATAKALAQEVGRDAYAVMAEAQEGFFDAFLAFVRRADENDRNDGFDRLQAALERTRSVNPEERLELYVTVSIYMALAEAYRFPKTVIVDEILLSAEAVARTGCFAEDAQQASKASEPRIGLCRDVRRAQERIRRIVGGSGPSGRFAPVLALVAGLMLALGSLAHAGPCF